MASNTSTANGLDSTPTGNPSLGADDPFASQRTPDNDPFAGDKLDKIAGADDMGKLPSPEAEGAAAADASPPASPSGARRMSKEWDASKVPPSRFQKRSGSIYSTPSSRDAHLDGADRDKGYWEKMKEKGWIKK